MYHDTPGRAFVTLSTPFRSRIIFFILPDGQLNEGSFLSFSIFSILLTPPLFFTFYLLFNLSLPPKTIYLYLLWHSKGFFSFDIMRNISDQWLLDKRQKKKSKHDTIQYSKRHVVCFKSTLTFLKIIYSFWDVHADNE